MNTGMIRKILIANRGEIAVRIIRACREMGIASVAVYSEADRESLHTQLADEAICIGPAASADSYLSMERVLSAAITSGADAIHPGFGFLSENSKFAALCEQCGLVFIGPKAEVIQKMGHKSQARNTMIQAGVPKYRSCLSGKRRAGRSGKNRIPGDDQSGARRRWKRDACIQFAGRVRALFPHSSKGSTDGIRGRDDVSGTFCATSEAY